MSLPLHRLNVTALDVLKVKDHTGWIWQIHIRY